MIFFSIYTFNIILQMKHTTYIFERETIALCVVCCSLDSNWKKFKRKCNYYTGSKYIVGCSSWFGTSVVVVVVSTLPTHCTRYSRVCISAAPRRHRWHLFQMRVARGCYTFFLSLLFFLSICQPIAICQPGNCQNFMHKKSN